MIRLWESNKTPLYNPDYGQEEPYIVPYIVDGARTCVVVCPGGGYGGISLHEAEPMAKMLNDMGISAFVLFYRVYPYEYPCETADVQRAVRVVRSLSDKYGYDKNKIGIMGFSAGGHLAASACVVTENAVPPQDDIDTQESSQPNFMILGYPVIMFDHEHTHFGTQNNITGGNRLLYDKLSLEKRVDDRTPPAFIWHTTDDDLVDVENSLYFMIEMRKRRIPVELHSFKSGPHGLGIAEGRPDIAVWIPLVKTWLEGMGFI